MPNIIQVEFIVKDFGVQGVFRQLALKSLPEIFLVSNTGGIQITDMYDVHIIGHILYPGDNWYSQYYCYKQ